jgi:hypothetical protein
MPNEADLDGITRGAAQHDAGRREVGAQRSDHMRVATCGARRDGRRGVEGEDAAEIAADGVAVDWNQVHVQSPVGPKRSVLTRDAVWPTSRSATLTASTNGVGPHT